MFAGNSDYRSRYPIVLPETCRYIRRDQRHAFLWIGSAPFSAPGQLRYTTAKGIRLLEGNISGSSGAEFQIEIQGGFALQPGSHVVL